MTPAFSSIKQAGAFALLLVILLLLPTVAGTWLLPPRSEVYASLTWRNCATRFFYQQLFEERSDIDIAFVGSSRMWAGIDTPYVQKSLSEQLGRKSTVLTLAWAWLGFDADYFITQDLLNHRKVRMLVFDDEFRADDEPHVNATHWFRFSENAEALRGLPLRIQAAYYFAAVLGMPRNLLSLIRPNIPDVEPSSDNFHWVDFFHAPNSKDRLGALTAERGIDVNQPFVKFTPRGHVEATDVSIYSAATVENFRFSGPPTTPWQMHFARKFATLAAEHNVKLVFLHLCPVYSSNETTNPVIEERECWPSVLGSGVTMMGIPPARLYSGIKAEDIPKLFYTADYCHFNQIGQGYFTRAITPTLLKIYGEQTSH